MGDRKSARIAVRITPQTRRELDELLHVLGISQSEYVRRTVSRDHAVMALGEPHYNIASTRRRTDG